MYPHLFTCFTCLYFLRAVRTFSFLRASCALIFLRALRVLSFIMPYILLSFYVPYVSYLFICLRYSYLFMWLTCLIFLRTLQVFIFLRAFIFVRSLRALIFYVSIVPLFIYVPTFYLHALAFLIGLHIFYVTWFYWNALTCSHALLVSIFCMPFFALFFPFKRQIREWKGVVIDFFLFFRTFIGVVWPYFGFLN